MREATKRLASHCTRLWPTLGRSTSATSIGVDAGRLRLRQDRRVHTRRARQSWHRGADHPSRHRANVITTWSSTFDNFNELKTCNRSGGGLPALNTTLAYDFNGNTLSETTASPAAVTTYTWDRDNRLRAVTPPLPGVPTSYSYDANGLRIERVDTTGDVRYLLEHEIVLAELDALSSTTTRFLNNPQRVDEVISFERGGAPFYPLTDALGSIYAIGDAGGAVTHRFDFDVYGVRTDLGVSVLLSLDMIGTGLHQAFGVESPAGLAPLMVGAMTGGLGPIIVGTAGLVLQSAVALVVGPASAPDGVPSSTKHS